MVYNFALAVSSCHNVLSHDRLTPETSKVTNQIKPHCFIDCLLHAPDDIDRMTTAPHVGHKENSEFKRIYYQYLSKVHFNTAVMIKVC